MLEMNNSYVRSFVAIDEQLQSGLLRQSVIQSGAARGPSVNITVDTTRRPRTTGRHPDTRRVTSRAVHRRPASRRRLSRHWFAGRIGNETHSKPSWDPIHYALLFPYGTDGFHLDIPKDDKAKPVTAMEY